MKRMALAFAAAASLIMVGILVNAASAEPTIVPLYVGPAPGSEQATQTEVSTAGKTGRVLRNVTVPTLTVYAPAPGAANGVAVIIAPGGGFHILSIDNEGTALARRLAARGVTAFVLKYRLNQTPANEALAMMQLMKFLGTIKSAPDGMIPVTLGETQASADAVQAMTLVRARAGAFGVDPHKVGFVGFSAGAVLALKVATDPDASVRPDFVAAIYGLLPTGLTPPPGGPPIFIAAASDDPLIPGKSLPIYQAWEARRLSAELHLYDKGGHGFGVAPQGTTSDHWLADFDSWLEEHRLITKQPG